MSVLNLAMMIMMVFVTTKINVLISTMPLSVPLVMMETIVLSMIFMSTVTVSVLRRVTMITMAFVIRSISVLISMMRLSVRLVMMGSLVLLAKLMMPTAVVVVAYSKMQIVMAFVMPRTNVLTSTMR